MSDVIEKMWQAGFVNKPEDLTEYIWYETDGNQILWNGENNLDDLYNETGDTYCEIINSNDGEIDGYVIYNISDSCGGSGQCIFALDKQVEAPDE